MCPLFFLDSHGGIETITEDQPAWAKQLKPKKERYKTFFLSYSLLLRAFNIFHKSEAEFRGMAQ
tara:strand:+ start:350 stop:541 length:192 start_codon:yes stop_codon:yes gene_type:complete